MVILFIGVIFYWGGNDFDLALPHGVREGSLFLLLELIPNFVKFNQSPLALVLIH